MENNENIRRFDLGIIISVISGRVFTEIENMYDILDYLTGDSIYTHQIPRVMDQVRPYILSIYPGLEGIGSDAIVTCKEEALAYIDEKKKIFGDSLPLKPITKESGYSHVDPLEELSEMILGRKK